ncbi:adhesion G-protein coupled receptor D2 [Rhineura floridana]|uniref:adhesion G-protein coupled receptor D2 n=1 Tax=Rhineura floridana TaxID=261503 RepID=UPI002AC858CA|nr:adhesion G-protein coupled receptor D2 [Rhineura floridana]
MLALLPVILYEMQSVYVKTAADNVLEVADPRSPPLRDEAGRSASSESLCAFRRAEIAGEKPSFAPLPTALGLLEVCVAPGAQASKQLSRWRNGSWQAGDRHGLRTLGAWLLAVPRTAGSGTVPLIIEMPGDVYEYVPTPLDWWHADGYCQQRFAQLPSEAWDGELASLGKKLQLHRVQSAIWLNDGEVFLRKQRQRRVHSALILVFKNKTDTKFVKVLTDFPKMVAVSACAHVQWDPGALEISTVFSYAVPAFINEFQVRGFVDEDGFVRFAIILHGHHSPYLPVFRTDGQWHHFCVTWQQQNGTWAIHADGKEKASATGLSASQAIDGHGTFIIGQDQDSLGGAFKEKESFSGNLTGLHVWWKVLSREQMEKVRSCITIEEGLVFRWSSDILEVEASVQQATVQLICPGPVEECRMLQVTHGSLTYAPCLQLLPFVCHYRKDLYLQLKKTQSTSVPPLIAQVNARANTTVIPESVFQADTRGVDVSAAADYLGVVETVLTDVGPPSLDAASLLGVFQLLRGVSDMEVNQPEQLQALEQLGRHYVEIAGIILEERNAEEWSEIKPILGGPMRVVENVDKMASSLHQLLSADRLKVTIQSKNVGVEVRRVELDMLASGSAAYVMLNQQRDKPDQIEVPAEEMERLRLRGLHQITITNTWYGYNSLQRLLAGGNAVFEDAAVSDGGRRYLSTQVSSSIISSTLVSDYEEISTSVHYRLRHQVQAQPDQFIEPVCAFWNFSRSPEGGGGWSTTGCSVVTSHVEFTACSCNHTTNFAVLLQVYDVQRSAEEESTLKTLTFVGCGVSFCALIVTFVLFLAVGVPKSERTTVHKNLIFALAAAEALLMFSELAKTNQGVCFAVTAFLHLFFMAAFAWMLVEGLLLWSKVVAVNMSEDRRMRFYYVTGWGLPVVIVGVTLATSFNKYVADNHCWLNVQTDIIWAFVGPVLFVLTVNTFVLFRVVMVTVSSARRRSRMLTPNSSLEKQIGIQIWATAKPVLVLLPVLGLTWVCGVLVHLSITWAYIFIVLNSLQGLYIFLVYAIYNSEVRNAIQRMKEKKKALSFTNCSHPINYLSSPRNTSWEVGKFNPSTPENTASPSIEKDSSTKNSSGKGNFSAKIPMGLSSIMSPERPAVQLTAFKSSGL